jgi:hypothetical protein
MNIKYYYLIATICCLFISSHSTSGQTRILEVPTHSSPSGSNWCVFGCTRMATVYYGNDTPECEIVEWARQNILTPNRGNSDCCNSPTPDDCFQGVSTGDIGIILDSENLNNLYSSNVISLSNLQSIINDNRPIVITGKSTSWGLHAMIIKGYDDNNFHYNDPAGGAYIIDYTTAVNNYDLGRYQKYKWDKSWTLTNQPCPTSLDLTQDIDSDADIVALGDINASCEIGANRAVTITSGLSVTMESGFFIPNGSTLYIDVSSNPCQ